MRPVLVLATDSLDPSGVGEHMLTLAGELAGAFEITVACPGNAAGQALLRRAASAGLRVRSIDAGGSGLTGWLHSVGAALLHVHAGIGWEGHGLVRAGKAAGLPVVRTEHLPFMLTSRVQQAEYLAMLQSVDQVIVVSEAARASYAPWIKTRLATVRNGIVPAVSGVGRAEMRLALGLSEAAPVLLTVARLTPQKGHRTLLAALPIVLAEQPQARLLLVGTGPEQADLEHLIDAAGLGEAVTFLGRRDDVADLLATADLFVLPSEFEGLPLVLLEAMAMGTPIVATAIGGSAEALGDKHPFLVVPGDPDALAAGILEALGEGSSGASAVHGKARFGEQFQASRMARETRALYAPLLTSTPSPTEIGKMTRTRIGFIGVGGIANRHLGVLEQFEDVDLVGFADVDFNRAADAAARFGARAYDSPEALLAGEKLDAVYICVPPFAHGPAERAAIAGGLPFFVEKPVSLDLELAEAIAAEVEASGLVTAVGYHWRYLDTVDEARRVLAERPAQLVSGYWLDQTPPPEWWWHADRSGGQMIEQTTHIIDLARYLVGDITQVFGLAGRLDRERFPGLDVPTVSTASLRFASGAIGNIGSTCLLNWGHRVGLHLFGDGFAIELTDHDIMVDTGAGRPYRQAEGDPVWREDRDFIDAVAGRENRIRCPYGEALQTHRVAVGISRSAESGAAIDLARSAQKVAAMAIAAGGR